MKNINKLSNKFSWFYKTPQIIKSFSITEKTLFAVLIIILLISAGLLLHKLNTLYLMERPLAGGTLTEGIVGYPRFINPVLASSNADKDLCALLYAGLLKPTISGGLIPDLAKSYTISEDGFVYFLTLKDNIYFHDGAPITTADVEFTINATQNSIIKSPKQANWSGVEIKIINDKEMQFILTQPYSPFLENLTLGILPKHIWQEISPEQFAFSQFNVEPIGAGPYQINKIKKTAEGVLEQYELRPFEKYHFPKAYISKLILKFYSSEDTLLNAYTKKEIEGLNSISPDKFNSFETRKDSRILSTALPRIFGVFFNQNENALFTNKEIRVALNDTVNKEKIIEQVLNNYGVAIDGPTPYKATQHLNIVDEEQHQKKLATAKELLRKNGWELNADNILEKLTRQQTTLFSFSISTAATPELIAVANLLKQDWEELGASVQIKIFEMGDLNQNIIRPRKYDSLLFGEVIGHDMDLFAFWHSSQRNDPGLNIAMYANITTDALLEKIRTTTDREERAEEFQKFQAEISKDIPAVFLYSPDFIYITPEKIKNNALNQITLPSNRFLDISNWYIKTEKIWKFFLNF